MGQREATVSVPLMEATGSFELRTLMPIVQGPGDDYFVMMCGECLLLFVAHSADYATIHCSALVSSCFQFAYAVSIGASRLPACLWSDGCPAALARDRTTCVVPGSVPRRNEAARPITPHDRAARDRAG